MNLLRKKLKSVGKTIHPHDDQVATVIAKRPYSITQEELKKLMSKEPQV
jgi:hypothetical protein